jgi:hypothetical protein
MKRRQFIAGLGGAVAAAAIAAAAVWRYVARAHRSDRVRAPRTVNRPDVQPVRSRKAGIRNSSAPT